MQLFVYGFQKQIFIPNDFFFCFLLGKMIFWFENSLSEAKLYVQKCVRNKRDRESKWDRMKYYPVINHLSYTSIYYAMWENLCSQCEIFLLISVPPSSVFHRNREWRIFITKKKINKDKQNRIYQNVNHVSCDLED